VKKKEEEEEDRDTCYYDMHPQLGDPSLYIVIYTYIIYGFLNCYANKFVVKFR
jgi:hypothetical protein